jgi:hypothetical protein
MTMVISGSDGITFPDSTTQNTTDRYGFVNRIINGDMRIDQRNAGASQAVTTSDAYCLDRFVIRGATGSGHTIQQVSDAPSGFNYSAKFTVGTGGSPAAGDRNYFRQIIEGYNFADLEFGTATAKTSTLSFWVKSSLTGTFGGAYQNSDSNRPYPFTYAISSANTWEYKTVTIAGDTSGTWLTTNGIGNLVYWDLGTGTDRQGTAGAWAAADYRAASGCVQVIATSSATWQITGVQLEVGSVATPFERRPYGTELALCQRYYWQQALTNNFFQDAYAIVANQYMVNNISLPVEMRATPTCSFTGTAFTNTNIVSNTIAGTSPGLISWYPRATSSGRFTCIAGSSGSFLQASSEL